MRHAWFLYHDRPEFDVWACTRCEWFESVRYGARFRRGDWIPWWRCPWRPK